MINQSRTKVDTFISFVEFGTTTIPNTDFSTRNLYVMRATGATYHVRLAIKTQYA